jgi:hypothetical protein
MSDMKPTKWGIVLDVSAGMMTIFTKMEHRGNYSECERCRYRTVLDADRFGCKSASHFNCKVLKSVMRTMCASDDDIFY